MNILFYFLTLFSLVSPDFIGIQCGDKVCGKNAICEDGAEEGLSPMCTCAQGFIGLPHEACFKSCLNDADCAGRANECVYHDPYFPQYSNISFFMYNYPYAHHRCKYDCAGDDNCGKNAVCQPQGNQTLKMCACVKGFVGLPYLQCFDPTPHALGRSDEKDDEEDVVKCPILEKTEGIKISCLDRDGTEHDCSAGGIPGTSAMFSCRTDFVPSNYKSKFSRMKCGSNGKWSQYKMFHCKRSAKLHYIKGSIYDPDYY